MTRPRPHHRARQRDAHDAKIRRAWPRRLCALACVALLPGTGSCSNTALDVTSAQRALGLATLTNAGLSLEAIPGRVNADDRADPVATIWSSAPVMRLTLETNSAATGTLSLTVQNLHRDARPRVVTIEPRAAGADFAQTGCPRVAAATPQCVGTEAGCPAPAFTRQADLPTTLALTIPLSPCRLTVIDLEPPARDDADVRVVVLGATDSLDTIDAVLSAEADADFAVLLGDHTPDADADRLVELRARVAQAPMPVVVLAGEQERLGDVDSVLFERLFGPTDFRWTLQRAQFVTTYTSEEGLGVRGIANLESFLRAMRQEDLNARGEGASEGAPRVLPAFAFTHVPPLAPVGFREDGFDSRLEAARALSLMSRYGIDTLFSGHVTTPAHETSSPQLRATTARNTRLGSQAEYLILNISPTPSSGARQVGERHVVVTRRAL